MQHFTDAGAAGATSSVGRHEHETPPPSLASFSFDPPSASDGLKNAPPSAFSAWFSSSARGARAGMEPYRFQVWLLFGCRMVQTIVRMTISPLLIYICDEFECTAQRKGGLLSAYSLGYFCTQILGGLAADVVGPRAVMTAALVLSALATLAAPGRRALGLSGVYATALSRARARPALPRERRLPLALAPERRARVDVEHARLGHQRPARSSRWAQRLAPARVRLARARSAATASSRSRTPARGPR